MLDGLARRDPLRLSLLREPRDDRAVHPAVRALVKHESAEVRQHALRLLARAGDLEVLHDVERLLYDEHLEVRTEALLYLTEHAHVDPLERIEQLGRLPGLLAARGDGGVSGAARPRAESRRGARDHRRDGDRGGRGRASARASRPRGCSAMLPDVFDRELRELLAGSRSGSGRGRDSRGRPAAQARCSSAASSNGWASRALTEQAVATLAGFDDAIVGTLRDTLVDDGVPVEIRREIPLVLQAIGTRASQFALMENLLDSDAVTRHRIITALNKLGQQHPDRRVDRKLLETVLARGDHRPLPLVSGARAALDSTAEREPESIAQALGRRDAAGSRAHLPAS